MCEAAMAFSISFRADPNTKSLEMSTIRPAIFRVSTRLDLNRRSTTPCSSKLNGSALSIITIISSMMRCTVVSGTATVDIAF
jgi:hypothetical protein